MLNKIFNITQFNSSIKKEVYAGFITFFAMSYIAFLNPIILKDSGIDVSSVFIATCLSTAFAGFLMAFYAKLPLAVSSGMGLNAIFTYTIVLTMGYSWQNALAIVLLVGVIIFIVAFLFNINALVNSVPKNLKHAITAGIGAFIIFIALNNAGIIVNHPATLVSLGKINSVVPISIILMFFVLLYAHFKNWQFMPIISIVLLTLLSIFLGNTHYNGLTSLDISVTKTFLQLDFTNLFNLAVIMVIVSIFFSSFFDSFGVLLSYNYLAKNSLNAKNTKRALQVQGLSSIASGLLGSSSSAIFLESNAGVSFGGRTGLVSLVIALLFLLTIFFSPLVSAVPIWAATPVLMYLGFLMLSAIKEIDFSDISEYIPALICLLIMPLTYSISYGISFGFISFVLLKIITKKHNDISKLTLLLALLFLLELAVK